MNRELIKKIKAEIFLMINTGGSYSQTKASVRMRLFRKITDEQFAKLYKEVCDEKN